MFGKFQDVIKECILKMINTNSTKFNNLKQSNNQSLTRDYYSKSGDHINGIENEFKDRSDKIKVIIIIIIILLFSFYVILIGIG